MDWKVKVIIAALLCGICVAFAADPQIVKAPEKAPSSEVAVPEDSHRDTGKGVQLTKEQKQKLEARRAAHRKQREEMVQKLKTASPAEKALARDSLAKANQNRDNEFHPTASVPDDRRKVKTKVPKSDDHN